LARAGVLQPDDAGRPARPAAGAHPRGDARDRGAAAARGAHRLRRLRLDALGLPRPHAHEPARAARRGEAARGRPAHQVAHQGAAPGDAQARQGAEAGEGRRRPDHQPDAPRGRARLPQGRDERAACRRQGRGRPRRGHARARAQERRTDRREPAARAPAVPRGEPREADPRGHLSGGRARARLDLRGARSRGRRGRGRPVLNTLHRIVGRHADLVLVVLMVCILIVLLTPIPPQLLDFLILANFCFALLLLLLTFYMEKPVEFSTFPSLLLIATLFRLSLNIAASRLIFSSADAGKVIAAIGSYVVGGNYIVGLIVFVILVVVQYVVVTNGAQRVAEVAARFTLDSMPGKQMSIDADLNMGLIDQEEARARRKVIEREANFYGSMDGASRFVKGDAVAGIIIILINIIGGLAIGISQNGLSWNEALETYTLLTVGDGIVTQIPALVIATGTGIIVTRAATDAQLSSEVARQVTAYPKTIALVGTALAALLLLPGIPIAPAFILLTAAAVVFISVTKQKASGKAPAPGSSGQSAAASGKEEDLYGLLSVEPLELVLGQNLVPLIGGDNGVFMERIVAFRKQQALDMGFVFPRVRIKDSKRLGPNRYEICLYGTRVGEGEIVADRWLAISAGNTQSRLEGIRAKDPTYGLPSVWILDEQRRAARDSGHTVVDAATVLLTHLTEVIKQQSPNLLTRAETERMVGRVRERQASLVEELI